MNSDKNVLIAVNLYIENWCKYSLKGFQEKKIKIIVKSFIQNI